MNKSLWKVLVPHIIAIAIFLIVTVIFCKPALEKDAVMMQSDNSQAQCMKQQLVLHQSKTGIASLWSTSMFSGMPAFQIWYPLPFNPSGYIDKILQFGLPQPLNFFFLACICFYIFCLCVGISPWIGIITSLAFAFSTYNPIIISVGHITKFLALAYTPVVLGGILLIFKRKYFAGFAITALFTSLHLIQNHQQITYYLLIIILIMTVSFIISWVKNKEFKHLGKSLSISFVAGLFGFLTSSTNLLTIYDFSKESKRGGQLIINNATSGNNELVAKSKGLDIDYAFLWSYGNIESFSLMFPGIQGYGTHYTNKDGETHLFPKLDENSNTVKYLQDKLNLPEDQSLNTATQLSTNLYWGPQPSTTGPVYLGAIICFLFIVGLFFNNNSYKWWLSIASIVGIILALGENAKFINGFLFDYLPLYNKFRAPSMALVIPQILFPIGAALTLENITNSSFQGLWSRIKKGLYATGAIFLVIILFYFVSDFSKENSNRTKAFNAIMLNSATSPQNQQKLLTDLNEKYKSETDNRLYENFMYSTKGNEQISKDILNALRSDRGILLRNSILLSLFYILATVLLIYLYLKTKINSKIFFGTLGVLILFDLITLDSKYLNDTNFTTSDKYDEQEFPMSEADKSILADKDPNYRVLDLSQGSDPFQDAKPSYYHQSIGGYHPAKLGIYDDLIRYQLSGKLNPNVLSMLNAKYIIQNDPQTQKPRAQLNISALGNAWFVKGIHWTKGPVQAMLALNDFSPKDTAIIDEAMKSQLEHKFTFDSTASIIQTKFENDTIIYKSNVNVQSPQLAVFSEIYYKDWDAYIDGKPAPIIKVNYVLRSILIPAGNHVISFEFNPKIYRNTYLLSTISSWIVFIFFFIWLGSYFFPIRKNE